MKVMKKCTVYQGVSIQAVEDTCRSPKTRSKIPKVPVNTLPYNAKEE